MSKSADPQRDIVFVLSDLSAGGAQRVAMFLLDAWVRRGWRVRLITLAAVTDIGAYYTPNIGVETVALGLVSSARGPIDAMTGNIRRLSRLRRAIRDSGASVVVSFVGTTNILTILATRGLGIGVVISERNDPSRQSLGAVWNWLRRLTYSRANVVTANSARAIDALLHYVPRPKLQLINNPIDPTTIASSGRHDQSTILAVGRLSYQKGFDIGLRAFASLDARYGAWRLQIAGEGPLRSELEKLAGDLGVSTRVDWLGRVSDVSALYAKAAFLIVPSRYEGTANVLIESAASRLPAIASRAAAVPHLVVDGESGFVVSDENPAALTLAMEAMIASRDLRERFGRSAQTRALEMTNPETILADWDRVLARAELS